MIDVDKYLEQQLKQLDIRECVREEIRTKLHGDIYREMQTIMKEEIKDLIKTECQIVLKSPINTDDGWGNKNNYNTFEDLFKSKFKEGLNNSYEVKRTISNLVKDKITSLMKEQQKPIIDKIVEELTKENK